MSVAPIRTPAVTPPRIAPIATLPLFHRLDGRKVVVAGQGDAVVWKAELVAAAGAEVLVLAGDRNGADRFAGVTPVAGSIRVEPCDWTEADLAGAALALGDIADAGDSARFIAAAHAAGAVVNMIDRTELCDVLFGTVVNRSPVVVGISTDGAAPALGQSVRVRIESVLPPGLARWAQAARDWRPRVKGAIADFADRRRLWQRFARRAWERIDRDPAESDFTALLAGAPDQRGSVTLVGAGPGDPELLTLKAVRALQTATVILYDDLVTPEVLELARREAKRIAVGKRGGAASCAQADICAEIVRLAQAGEAVVRLKGGDPGIFGRATEEIDACHAAGVPVAIVPGITAAQAAAASLGISLTERVHARRVQFVTGHGADGALPHDIDWHAIADAHATTVIYMPKKTLAAFAREAIAAGLDPAMPALAVASIGRADQRHIAAPIASVATELSRLPTGAPVTVIVGQVARSLATPAESLAA